MKLSIIIPVYNEEKTIETILDKVKKVNLDEIEKEIIVVDDGSTDNSRQLIKKIKGIKLITQQRNMGKGSAVRTGLKYSTGEFVSIQDADLEYDPKDYKKLLNKIKNGANVVYGSRFLNKTFKFFGKNKTILPFHYLGNKLLVKFVNFLFNSNLTDIETCYKLVKHNVLLKLNLKANGFDIEPEITAKLLKRGYKIEEVPISFNPRSFKEGKKIKWKDGLKAFWTLIKYKIND